MRYHALTCLRQVTRGDFLGEFVTPILKAQRGSETNSFFSVDEYSSWWNAMAPTEKAKWRVKYYKGLGTSSAAEAREYFTSLEQTVKMFSHDGFVCTPPHEDIKATSDLGTGPILALLECTIS